MSRGEAEDTRPMRDRGNNSEARQGRGEASKRRGEAEVAIMLPRGEASSSRHTSLSETNIFNNRNL